MIVLGPSAIKDGLTPATAIIGCRGMALLGPNDPSLPTLDPIHRIFLIVGKILSIRRVITPESPFAPQECAIKTFKGVQMATIDQATDGQAGDFPAWDVVWSPLGKDVKGHINELQDLVGAADLATKRLMDMESARILGLDPELPLPEKVEAVMHYMSVNGLTVEHQRGGMRDYLMRLFRDTEDIPVAFPASAEPTFPDQWITPDVITPEIIGRAWLIIL